MSNRRDRNCHDRSSTKTRNVQSLIDGRAGPVDDLIKRGYTVKIDIDSQLRDEFLRGADRIQSENLILYTRGGWRGAGQSQVEPVSVSLEPAVPEPGMER